MSGELFTLPRQFLLTNSGSLMPGAKAYFYIYGTSTPQDTYQDVALTTPHANPVIADGNGRFPAIYINDSLRYKVKLTDSSNSEIYSEDDFTSPFAWGWSQTASESAESIIPVDEQKYPGDALRYGALVDGSTDDTTAFQNAVDSGHPAFCDVSGTTNIEGTIVLDGDKSLRLNVGLNFERQSGASTAPMIHLYGSKSVFDPQE